MLTHKMLHPFPKFCVFYKFLTKVAPTAAVAVMVWKHDGQLVNSGTSMKVICTQGPLTLFAKLEAGSVGNVGRYKHFPHVLIEMQLRKYHRDSAKIVFKDGRDSMTSL